MSSEWLLIALPVVFVLGWVAARLDIRHINKSARELPRIYLRGLTHLLNRDDDKALDAFLEIESHDSAQLQFALGDLCRRKGEHERALHIHRRLYNREDLPVTERHQALWALSQDFYNVGLIDYTEKYTKLLLSVKEYQERALNQLLTVYQRRRDYQSALTLLAELGDDAVLLRRATVAQFYCEIADAADNTADRQHYHRKALATNPDCVRAMMALIPHEAAETAARYRRQIEQCAPQYLWMLLPHIDDPGNTVAEKWLETHPSPILFEEMYKRLSDETQRQQLCETVLAQHQYRRAAQYWLEKQNRDGDLNPWLALKELFGKQNNRRFACCHCDYQVKHFSWQCPGCLQWESFRPL